MGDDGSLASKQGLEGRCLGLFCSASVGTVSLTSLLESFFKFIILPHQIALLISLISAAHELKYRF